MRSTNKTTNLFFFLLVLLAYFGFKPTGCAGIGKLLNSLLGSDALAPFGNDVSSLLALLGSSGTLQSLIGLLPLDTCVTNQNGLRGVCMSNNGCRNGGGRSLGTCGLTGNGVCCLITVKAANVSSTILVRQRATLLQNGDSSTDGSIQTVYEFPKQPGICQLSLYFQNTKLADPETAISNSGYCRNERITVDGTSSVVGGSITVCGDLVGQHMHLAYDHSGLTDTNSERITITIRSSRASTLRYSLNTVYVRCDDPDRVSGVCLQHFQADTGIIKSFGFPRQLANQNYHVCTKSTRPNAVYLTYEECPSSVTGGAPAFFVSGSTDAVGSPPGPSIGEAACPADYLYSDALNPPARYCGGKFPKSIIPFPLGHLTVNFDYTEIGSNIIVENLPPSVTDCADMTNLNFPFHTCVAPAGEEVLPHKTCICSIGGDNSLDVTIPVPAGDACPTMTLYTCERLSNVAGVCSCKQDYHNADQGNTGFCLKFTHSY